MKQTILFADNEHRIRQYCKQELECLGFRVVLAEDGEDALAALNVLAVDLVILDQHMPRCSGLEAAKRVKQRFANLPVILFTADEDYRGYKSRHVDECVIKAADLSTLQATIQRLIADPARAAAQLEKASGQAWFKVDRACSHGIPDVLLGSANG